MKKLIILGCSGLMLLLSSCAAISDDTYYRMGYDIGSYYLSEDNSNSTSESTANDNQLLLALDENVTANEE